MSIIEKADGLGLLEGNIKADENRRVPFDFSGIIEPGMLTNDYMVTRETLRLFQG